jgi:hypothetical protein
MKLWTKKTKKPVAAGKGKGNLTDNNPMLGTRERSAQLNNLGKHGEPKAESVSQVKNLKDI